MFGFGWNLPKSLEWEREYGQEKHTPFRALGGPFVVFVNAQVDDSKLITDDLWKSYNDVITLLEKVDALVEKETGKIAYERTYEKCTLLGQHAIK